MAKTKRNRKPLTEEQKEAKRAYMAVYNAAHRDEQRAYSAARRLTHHEETIAACRNWREAYPERAQASHASYYARHREEVCAKARRYYGEHQEEYCVRSAAWRAAHPEEVLLAKQLYNELHREEQQAYYATYHAAHRPEHVEHGRKRRARKASAPINDFTAHQWRAMQKHYQHRCVYCSKRAKGHLTQDHITPLVEGGSHTASNIVPACRSCNSRKGKGGVLRPIQPLLLV